VPFWPDNEYGPITNFILGVSLWGRPDNETTVNSENSMFQFYFICLPISEQIVSHDILIIESTLKGTATFDLVLKSQAYKFLLINTWGARTIEGPNPFVVSRTGGCGLECTILYLIGGTIIVVVELLTNVLEVTVWLFGTVWTWFEGMMTGFWQSAGVDIFWASSSSTRSTSKTLCATGMVMGWKGDFLSCYLYSIFIVKFDSTYVGNAINLVHNERVASSKIGSLKPGRFMRYLMNWRS